MKMEKQGWRREGLLQNKPQTANPPTPPASPEISLAVLLAGPQPIISTQSNSKAANDADEKQNLESTYTTSVPSPLQGANSSVKVEELNSDSTSQGFVLHLREAANCKVAELSSYISASKGSDSPPVKDVTSDVSLPPISSLTSSSSFSASSPILTTEWFHISPSLKGGYGSFALQDITDGTMILSEPPLFQCQDFGMYQAFEDLSTAEQTEYMKLACWNKVGTSQVECIFRTNRFVTGNRTSVFLKAARFNHACKPCNSCTYFWSETEKRMKFFANRDIAKGEEITITYSTNPGILYGHYGFFCECYGCATLTKEEKREVIEKVEEEYRALIKSTWG